MLSVKKIDHKTAAPFVLCWHYSNKMPTGKNIYFGMYIDDETELYAVAVYGIGVNRFQAQSLSRMTKEDVTNGNLLELRRLCRREPRVDKYPLTMFVSRCHRALKADGYRYIVSFSDPEHSHNGGIYRACNFTHLGKTNAEYHVIDSNGVIRHRMYYVRYAERNWVSKEQAILELGLKRIRTLPKDRWFIKIK